MSHNRLIYSYLYAKRKQYYCKSPMIIIIMPWKSKPTTGQFVTQHTGPEAKHRPITHYLQAVHGSTLPGMCTNYCWHIHNLNTECYTNSLATSWLTHLDYNSHGKHSYPTRSHLLERKLSSLLQAGVCFKSIYVATVLLCRWTGIRATSTV